MVKPEFFRKIALILLILLPWLIFAHFVRTTEIVVFYHPGQNNYKIAPKIDLWYIPLVFSAIFIYNLILGLVFKNLEVFDKLNLIVVAVNLISWLYLFYLNF
ncbi:MAG: hypothetical protein M1505_00015 [Patescibacteria group bacterium]|nr:hypothetical protein [Patescibacteria group bacterium]